MQSYVISVSAGKGSYRHIQIAADATLFDLHTAILDAFEFIDDHAHAFFMDNKIWSMADSYYSDPIEDERRHTRDFRLGSLALQPGKRFKYVFDFGDEWVFQCRVLRLLNEPCDTPVVVRSAGEPPDQYAPKYDFDADEDSERREYGSDGDEEYEIMYGPEIYTPAKLKRLYAKFKLPDETVELLHSYFDAMARLYGVIPLRKALEIINAQNDPISESDFLSFAEIVRHEDQIYSILGEDDLYADGRATAPLDREIVENSLYTVDLRVYERTVELQRGKPYYIPPKRELLLYADDDYYEQTPQSRAMRDYLRRKKKMTEAQAGELMLELQLYASMAEDNFEFIIDHAMLMGLNLESFADMQDFISLYTELNNHSRMAINRGHTPAELAAMRPVPEFIPFSPNLTAARPGGGTDMDALRKGILQMESLNESLRGSMPGGINRVGTAQAPGAAVKKEKNGGNESSPA